MIDPTEHETDALVAAGEKAGEYLDSIGIAFPAMSFEQWMTMIEVAVTGFQDKLGDLKALAPVEDAAA